MLLSNFIFTLCVSSLGFAHLEFVFQVCSKDGCVFSKDLFLCKQPKRIIVKFSMLFAASCCPEALLM